MRISKSNLSYFARKTFFQTFPKLNTNISEAISLILINIRSGDTGTVFKLLNFPDYRVLLNTMGGFQQRPWTPTKRRGPIAAEFASPGPASVTLPTTIGTSPVESKTGRSPAFSFGNRHNNKLDTVGPGPGQYNVTGLSAKGKDSPKAASLHGRPKEHKTDNTPAPGDYDPNKAESVIHDNSPKYTFGLKTNIEKPADTPAPNSYNVNGHPQNSPMFSFGSRNSIDKIPDTPAPNAYNIGRFDSLPRYSFGIRTKTIRTPDTPAPNSYNIRRVNNNSPKFTIVGKRLTKSTTDSPAPNVYNIPNTLGDKKSAPAYTISGRNKEPVDERVKNPGPGTYNNVDPITYKEHAPAYTMSGRTNIPNDHLNVPGPGVYSPEKVQLDIPPAHSFGIRHSPYAEHY